MSSRDTPGCSKRLAGYISLIVLGIGISIGARHLHNYLFPRGNRGDPSRTVIQMEKDAGMLVRLHGALSRNDVTAINEILEINKGELELLVRVCPVYPAGFCPIARIELRNVSHRAITILRPEIVPMTRSSRDEGGSFEEFDVEWSMAGHPNWCRVLEPNEVFALPPTELEVFGEGIHEVRFTLTGTLFKYARKSQSLASAGPLCVTTVLFTVGEREGKGASELRPK